MGLAREHSRIEAFVCSAALVALLGMLLGGCGSSSTAERPLPGYGQFAGYIAYGRVDALSAAWTVPRVISGTGGAGTWIGAEAAGHSSAPFIQIGTSEERFWRSQGPAYLAFWTDTRHRYRAVGLFRVAPDDHITASLRLRRSQWQLEIVDATSGVSAHFSTGQEASAKFEEAQWLQEASAPKRTDRVLDYPKLAPVGMQALKLNSHTPLYARVRASWMSVGDQEMAPSPLRGGAFTIVPASLSAAGARYLQIARPADEAYERFAIQAVRWSSATPRAQVHAAVSRLSRALVANVTQLAQADWPAAAKRPIDRLIASERTLLKELQSIDGRATSTTWRRVLKRQTGELGLEIRRALHAPELAL